MSSPPFIDISLRPSVAFFSEPSSFSLCILEVLVSNFCRVVVFSDAGEKWKQITEHINLEKYLDFTNYSSERLLGGYDYVISVLEDFGQETQNEKVGKIFSCSNVNLAKTIFVLPYSYRYSQTESTVAVLRNRAETAHFSVILCFVGDILGPRMNFEPKSELFSVIKEVASGVSIRIPGPEFFFYPTFAPDAAKEIVRSLFSFGPPAEEFVIFGQEVNGEGLKDILSTITGSERFTTIGFAPRKNFVIEKIVKAKTPAENAIKESLAWFKDIPKIRPVGKAALPPPIPPIKERVKPKRNRKVFLKIILFVLSLLLLPFFLLVFSGGMLVSGGKFLEKGKITYAKTPFILASFSAGMAKTGFSFLTAPPVLGQAFYPLYSLSSFVKNTADTGTHGLVILNKTTGLLEKILGDTVYDPNLYSQDIYLSLGALYQELGFLEGEANSLKGLPANLVKRVLRDNPFSGIRTKTLALRDIAHSASIILGAGKPATYLLLFQNNMELRPTGGFIGSFALVTFDGGRLVDIGVQDVYSADGQLKGFVAAPEPIKLYLNEANWFLRESNWDPDFPTSASRAEWFLSKEIGQAVDGVVAIDLEVAKSMLKVIGPVKIPDYDYEVNAENLYEVMQGEVEEDFFPGSYKKTNFLTAVARQLLSEITGIEESKRLPLGKELVRNLEDRHIQIFLHEKEVQKSISALGFDGAFLVPSCSDNCYSDWLGIVEANLGVNKANYFIKRNATFFAELEGESIDRRLEVEYQNLAKPELGIDARYKVYVRGVIPQDAQLISAEQFSQGERTNLTPDIKEVRGRKEVGVLLEVWPGETKALSLSWQSKSPLDYSASGEYRLYWRKQAGTASDPIVVSIKTPAQISPRFNPKFSLTQEGEYVYNTTLGRDLFSLFSW